MKLLPTNYQNEILNDAMSNRRQYQLVENSNGTYSFIDVTVYDQEGSLFDADDINAITSQINININDISIIQQILESGVVNGIRGASESDYRVGKVTLTATQIGTYTKNEIDTMISAISGMHFEIVNELPTDNISPSTIYLVPTVGNAKDEYVYITSYEYTDVTEQCEVVDDYESLPSLGEEDIFYITKDDEKVYVWDEGNENYVLSPIYTAEIVTVLPAYGSEGVLYVDITDNTVSTCTITNSWEKIGSTEVDLSGYYTKIEIDTNALISTTEFENLD